MIKKLLSNPLIRNSIVLLVLLSVLIAGSEIYFYGQRQKIYQNDFKLSNIYAHQNLNKVILREVLNLENQLYQINFIYNDSSYQLTNLRIENALRSITDVLYVFENGGIYEDRHIVAQKKSKNIVENIRFRPYANEEKMDEIESLTPLISSTVNLFNELLVLRANQLNSPGTGVLNSMEDSVFIAKFNQTAETINLFLVKNANHLKQVQKRLKEPEKLKRRYVSQYPIARLGIVMLLIGFIIVFLLFSNIPINKLLNRQKEEINELQNLYNELKFVFDKQKIALLIFNTKGTLLSYNKTCEDIFDIVDANYTNKRNKDIEISILYKNIQSIKKKTAKPFSRLILTTKEGKNKEVIFNKLEDRKNSRIYITFIEVENLRIEKSAIIDNEQSNSGNLESNQFIETITNEFHNPINLIISFARILDKSTGSGSKDNLFVKSILSNSNNLLAIIEDVNEIIKIDNETAISKTDIVRSSELLSNLNNYLSPLSSNEKEIPIDIVKSEILPEILMVDEKRLRQIISNLVRYKLKSQYSGIIRISFSDSDKNADFGKTNLKINIQSSGQELPQLGDVLKKADKLNISTNKDTPDINLTIAKKLANTTNLDLQTGDSPFDNICVIIPNIKKTKYEGIKAVKEEKSSLLFSPATILVVDDNEINRNLVIELLRNTGLSFIEAETGKDAIYMMKTMQPQLVFMDIIMPEMTGIEAIKIIKQDNDIKDIPVVAITTVKSIQEKQKIIEQGFYDLLDKPINIEKLFSVIVRIVKFKQKEASLIKKKKNTKAGLNDLNIIELNDKIMYDWKKARDSKFMNDIEEFGNILLDFSKKHKISKTENFANELLYLANSFDVNNLILKLETFPEFVNDLIENN